MKLGAVQQQPREVATTFEAAQASRAARGLNLPAGGKDLPAATKPSVEEVRKAAEDIERFLRSVGHRLSFAVDDETGRTVISVRDSETGELIRQVPSEEALRIARNLDRALPTLIREQA